MNFQTERWNRIFAVVRKMYLNEKKENRKLWGLKIGAIATRMHEKEKNGVQFNLALQLQ